MKTRYTYCDYRGGHYDPRCKSRVGGDVFLKCENCSHAEDEYYANSYKSCPKCGATIVRKGDNLRILIKTMQSRQKLLMLDMNSRGKFAHLDDVEDDEIENMVKAINDLYDKIAESVKAKNGG